MSQNARGQGRGQGGAAPTPPVAPASPETIQVTSRRIMCDGGGGPLGHPRVFYDLGESGVAECLYCDRRFELAAGAGDDGH